MLSFAVFGQEGKVKEVGEEIIQHYASPHPYAGTENKNGEIVWSEEITSNGASYIAVHFSKVQLSKGDYIVVKSPDSERFWKYVNLSVEPESEGLWSVHIYGEKAIIEIHSKNKEGSYGYSIDKIARGYSEIEMKENIESICVEDNSEEAVCYEDTEPAVYDNSRAIARLLINGTNACTGWLIGSDGHLMTNNHCVQNATIANNVTVEFMAEGADCDTNCQTWFGCPGTIEATSTAIVQTNYVLDYTLLQLPSNVTNTYGFLQLRSGGPVLNERIYIPQHPGAHGKRIALISDTIPGALQVGFTSITSLTEARCRGGNGNDIGYLADTQGGSSGSPVMSYADHSVIALHHCGGCENLGVASDEIINDLGANLPPNGAVNTNCLNNATFTTPLSGFIEQEVSDWIEGRTNNIIQVGADVTYDAGNQVRLRPGFRAITGSRFRAFIDGCGGNAKLNAESNDLEEVENDIGLSVYPNPFGETANLSYILTDETEVTIYLFDSAGKRVATLTKNQPHQAGQHQLKLDASNLATGMYYLKLQSNENNIIKKLMIAK